MIATKYITVGPENIRLGVRSSDDLQLLIAATDISRCVTKKIDSSLTLKLERRVWCTFAHFTSLLRAYGIRRRESIGSTLTGFKFLEKYQLSEPVLHVDCDFRKDKKRRGLMQRCATCQGRYLPGGAFKHYVTYHSEVVQLSLGEVASRCSQVQTNSKP
jgi:hypothetical protein